MILNYYLQVQQHKQFSIRNNNWKYKVQIKSTYLKHRRGDNVKFRCLLVEVRRKGDQTKTLKSPLSRCWVILAINCSKKPWEKINSFSTSKKRIDTRASPYNDYYVIKKTGFCRQMNINNLVWLHKMALIDFTTFYQKYWQMA